MTYKGYELRKGVKTKFVKGSEILEVDAWGIYANGDFKGSVRTREQAIDYIDQISRNTLHKPRDRTHVIQRTDYNTHGNIDKTIVYREA